MRIKSDEHATPIILVFGPSGVGKSTFAAYLAARGWLHLEIDQFTAGDGIDIHQLRAPWDTFCAMANAWPLEQDLRGRMAQTQSKGCVVTFPSGSTPPLRLILAAEQAGLKVVCLYATAADCLSSFLQRERDLGRNLDQAHWLAHNSRCYLFFSQPEFQPWRVTVFHADGVRRPQNDLLNTILRRAAVRVPARPAWRDRKQA